MSSKPSEIDNLHKIDILKTALLQEKQKNQETDKKNQELSLKIAFLEKENKETKAKLSEIEKNNQFSIQITDTNDSSWYIINNNKPTRTVPLSVNEYELIITKYEVQSENLKKMVSEANASLKTMKSSFQSLISELDIEKRKLEEKLSLQLEENQRQMKVASGFQSMNKSLEIRNEQLKNELKNEKEDKEKVKEDVILLKGKIDELMSKKSKLEMTIKGYSQINESLQGKIDELKNILIDDKLIEVTFVGYKKEVLKKKSATLKFSLHENSYCIVLAYSNQPEKYVPLMNFEYVRVVNQGEDLVEIKYLKEDKKSTVKSYVFEGNSLNFVNAYKEYSLKDMRRKNNEEIIKKLQI